jgi:arabinogalactan oligomer/maltooligosaccharide transport system substrate-binding protein
MKVSSVLVRVVSIILLFLVFESAVVAAELTIWQSDSPEAVWMQKMGKLYEEKTDISITIETITEEEQDEILSIRGPQGAGPDIVGFAHDHLGAVIKQGLVVPIEDYLAVEYIEKNYSELAIDALTYKDQIYGLPYSYEAIALVYNKELITKIPESFDKLKKKAEKLTNVDNNQFGFIYDYGSLYRSYAFISGFGGYTFAQKNGTYDLTDIGLATEGTIAGLNYLKSFAKEGLIVGDVDADKLFKEGKVAMTLTGPWNVSEYREAGIDIGVKAMPKLPNGKYPKPFVGVVGYYISSYSERKQEAAKFIQWLTDIERAHRRLEDLLQVIPHKELLTSSELKEKEILKEFMIQTERGTVMPNIPEMSFLWAPTANGIEFIVSEQKSAEKIMPLVVKQIKDRLQ